MARDFWEQNYSADQQVEVKRTSGWKRGTVQSPWTPAPGMGVPGKFGNGVPFRVGVEADIRAR